MEMWEHIVKCRETKYLRKDFVKDLIKEMIKEAPKNTSIKKIFKIIDNILRYLENDESDDYKTNQGIIGL